MSEASPFHAAELALQQRAGVRAAAAAAARGIRSAMPEQHRQFFAELPLMFFGGLDGAGQPWATLRVGAPGFVTAPTPTTLRIGGHELAGDPLAGTWQVGAMVGGLGLQAQTRRRNRVNGVLTAVDGDGMTLQVSQSFGNCPKYINSRTPSFIDGGRTAASAISRADRLDVADQALLRRADTFYIASANTAPEAGAARGVDVSHRGGRPGFVRIDDDRTLTTPDYSGNNFFNTLGNLAHDRRAGLLFIDDESGDVLHIAADAEIIWERGALAEFPGAERLLRLHIRDVRRSAGALPLRWSAVEPAPQFAATSAPWRALNVVRRHAETPGICSFYLAPADGAALAPNQPGQYLTVQIPVPGQAAPLVRNYTLSDSHDGRAYRISVKRAGLASAWLHDHLHVGAQLHALAPGGEFTYDAASGRPAVLLSAGIGITPMLALARAALDAGRPVHFVHAARSAAERPFGTELEQLAARHANLSLHLLDGDTGGRLTVDKLKRLLPWDDYDFYLCGPGSFMADLYQGLRALTIADQRIRFEAFGAASVRRSADPVTASAAVPVDVTFARSRRVVPWTAQQGSLLELAEANGIAVPSSCRSGACGTCATRIGSGAVTYTTPPSAPVPAGCALLCVAIPAGRLTLDI